MEVHEKNKIKILETPRDAMQGLQKIIPTGKKAALINSLLRVGFDIVDIGSFVSPQAVPQMKDTEEVLRRIEPKDSRSEIFVLVVNPKGAKAASTFERISYLGFPFSTSETFLKKNINSDFEKAWKTLCDIQNICIRTGKNFMVYLSMAFGNPYGDPDDPEQIYYWVDKLNGIGIRWVSISDIIGAATASSIAGIYSELNRRYPEIGFGIHLHISGGNGLDKIHAAYTNGCSIFDGVINGMGGCPMSGYELLGNLNTKTILDYAEVNHLMTGIDKESFAMALDMANQILG